MPARAPIAVPHAVCSDQRSLPCAGVHKGGAPDLGWDGHGRSWKAVLLSLRKVVSTWKKHVELSGQKEAKWHRKVKNVVSWARLAISTKNTLNNFEQVSQTLCPPSVFP